MSCIVYQTNKKTGIKYAYESVSYWDKEKGQPRSRRKYLGRVDPETGEIVKKSSVPSGKSDDTAALQERIQELEKELDREKEQAASLRKDLSQLQEKYRKTQDTLRRIHRLSSLQQTEE